MCYGGAVMWADASGRWSAQSCKRALKRPLGSWVGGADLDIYSIWSFNLGSQIQGRQFQQAPQSCESSFLLVVRGERQHIFGNLVNPFFKIVYGLLTGYAPGDQDNNMVFFATLVWPGYRMIH